MVWRHQQIGIYSVRSFLLIVETMQNAQVESHNIFKNILSRIISPRVELLVWFIVITKLKTKDHLNELNVLSNGD